MAYSTHHKLIKTIIMKTKFTIYAAVVSLLALTILVPFEKSGHASFIEEKDKFNEEFIKFLNK